MAGREFKLNRRFVTVLTFVAAVFLIAGVACNSAGPGSTSNPPGGDSPTDNENVTLNETLGYEGTLTGKVAETRSTRESTSDPSAQQTLPPGFDTEAARILFFDIAGNPLVDPDGEPMDSVPVQSDGSYSADELPVGVDFTVCVDLNGDADCELQSSANIPSDDGGGRGHLENHRIDPLTTLVHAKLLELMEEEGISPHELPVSPTAVVRRIVEAYVHLFEEGGVDHEIALEDLEGLSLEELGRLFDELIPSGARSGMQMVEGNLRLARAREVEDVALGAAEVFLRAGFPVADPPGGLDLSPLADLEGVIVTSMSELFPVGPGDFPGDFPDGFPDDFLDDFPDGFPDDFLDDFPDGFPDDFLDNLPDDFPDDFADDMLSPAQVEGFTGLDHTIYISTIAEPDRNFANQDEDEFGEGDMGSLPIIGEHVLMSMARLKLEGRTVTLGDLYQVLTDADHGLGARLTYFIADPSFFGPPLTVFETADGNGKAMNTERLFREVADQGLTHVDEDTFAQNETDLRRLLKGFLEGTIPPAFERLFDGFIRDRVRGIDDLAHRIRDAQAHLPFSRSGPSSFFVVADGDPFRHEDEGPTPRESGEVDAVTVDAEVSVDGEVLAITYNAGGSGQYYLGFTERTEETGDVELMVRETGRRLHGRRRPVRVSMLDEGLFAPVNGTAFFDFVSESGAFYPGTHVTVLRQDFRPEVNAEFLPDSDGPHLNLFVLATKVGRGAEPVRVDYDPGSGQATYNPWGRHFLMFLPDTEETGLFGLFNEDTGREAHYEDPNIFFDAPPERPDRFEDFFNEFQNMDGQGDLADFEHFDDLNDFVEGVIDLLPPPDGDFPTDDGNRPPDDGDFPTDDGDSPPDDDGSQPPEDDSPDSPDEPADDPTEPGGEDDVDPAEVGGDETDEPEPDSGSEPDGDYPPPPDGEFAPSEPIRIALSEVIGLDIERETFTHVFGIEVPNEGYNPSQAPYYDDINGNDVQDSDEPTAPFRPMLFDPTDWRSTDIPRYYRRADNGGSADFEDILWDASTPKAADGVELVPRNWRPRLNAFRFGRPNTAINLLTAFAQPEFFDGTHTLNRETRVDVFMAVAIINLVMDQVFNVEADVDIDGLGPHPRLRMLMDAHLFVLPVDDPFILLMEGVRERAKQTELPLDPETDSS